LWRTGRPRFQDGLKNLTGFKSRELRHGVRFLA
jgi:hypothetical protein